jgi:uncharacterized protein
MFMNQMPFFIRRFLITILTLLAALAVLSSYELSNAQDAFPPPRGAVNDFAGVISPADAARWRLFPGRYSKKQGCPWLWQHYRQLEIMISMIMSIAFIKLGHRQKRRRSGTSDFPCPSGRQIRIETGYGLEGILPDGVSVGYLMRMLFLISEKEITALPCQSCNSRFPCYCRRCGVTLTDDSISKPSSSRRELRNGGNFWLWFIILLIIPLLGTRRGREYLPLILMMLLSSRRGGGGGGGLDGFGGFGGGFGGFGGGSSGGGGASRGF